MCNKLHSLMFVPATKDKMKNAFSYKADALIFDLEDSIKENQKRQCLENLIDYLGQYKSVDKQVFVRLNSGNLDFELEKLEPLGKIITGYVIPKVEGNKSLAKVQNLDKKIIALIETPLAFVNIKDIVSNICTSAIAFGAEDYCSATGMINDNDYLRALKTEIVKYARAYNKICYDTISKEISETEKLKEDICNSKNMGFDGKLAIHPNQLSLINYIFSEINREIIIDIIKAFEKNENGVVVYDGIVYELPHIEYMKKKLGEIR